MRSLWVGDELEGGFQHVVIAAALRDAENDNLRTAKEEGPPQFKHDVVSVTRGIIVHLMYSLLTSQCMAPYVSLCAVLGR